MTYSIIGRDPVTGEIGIAVQSRYFAVGNIVPWIEAGVGAIASQAFSNPVYGHKGLDLLRAGASPEDALTRLTTEDPGAALRQVAILDVGGRVAAYTGGSCVAAAGHASGGQCAAQANMMARDTVWPAMIHAFEGMDGPLADQLVAALTAAEKEGGDIRGAQAAALIVVAGKSADGSGRDRIVDLRIDDHPDPVGEIKRLLAYWRANERAKKATDKVGRGDFHGALADLEASCHEFPLDPDFLCRLGGALMALGRLEEAREAMARACAIGGHGWAEFLMRMADARLIPASRDMLGPLMPQREGDDWMRDGVKKLDRRLRNPPIDPPDNDDPERKYPE